MKKIKQPKSNGLTPDKQKRRPSGGDPSPSRVLFKISPGTIKQHRPQGK